MGMMQHKIETDTSCHIRRKNIYLEAMFLEHQLVEVDPLMKFKSTSDPNTIYMH